MAYTAVYSPDTLPTFALALGRLVDFLVDISYTSSFEFRLPFAYVVLSAYSYALTLIAKAEADFGALPLASASLLEWPPAC